MKYEIEIKSQVIDNSITMKYGSICRFIEQQNSRVKRALYFVIKLDISTWMIIIKFEIKY